MTVITLSTADFACSCRIHCRWAYRLPFCLASISNISLLTLSRLPFISRYRAKCGDADRTPRGNIRESISIHFVIISVVNKLTKRHGKAFGIWVVFGIHNAKRPCPRGSCSSTSNNSTFCPFCPSISTKLWVALFIVIVQSRNWNNRFVDWNRSRISCFLIKWEVTLGGMKTSDIGVSRMWTRLNGRSLYRVRRVRRDRSSSDAHSNKIGSVDVTVHDESCLRFAELMDVLMDEDHMISPWRRFPNHDAESRGTCRWRAVTQFHGKTKFLDWNETNTEMQICKQGNRCSGRKDPLRSIVPLTIPREDSVEQNPWDVSR